MERISQIVERMNDLNLCTLYQFLLIALPRIQITFFKLQHVKPHPKIEHPKDVEIVTARIWNQASTEFSFGIWMKHSFCSIPFLLDHLLRPIAKIPEFCMIWHIQWK